jgi:XTP/dITP diphosphohydrolase
MWTPAVAMHKTLTMTLATKNEGKRLELEHWIRSAGLPVQLVLNPQAEDVDETGATFLKNARLKASLTPPVTESGLVLAEDSGMVVDALDGSYGISPFPGLYSNRWLTPAIRDELLGRSHPNRLPLDRVTEMGMTNTDLCLAILKLMEGKTDRTARYCCGMALWHADMGLLFETLETTELIVAEAGLRGMNGFGYDPIMRPMGESRTMAELSVEEKNHISHRGRAFRKVLAWLQENEPQQ